MRSGLERDGYWDNEVGEGTTRGIKSGKRTRGVCGGVMLQRPRAKDEVERGGASDLQTRTRSALGEKEGARAFRTEQRRTSR